MIKLTVVLASVITLTGCVEQSNKYQQAEKAAAAAESLNFTTNAEIENIKKRLELTSKPEQVGYIVLLNQMGQPILYEPIKGKITSSGKRLTKPYSFYSGTSLVAPSDEGTWGSSDQYIYYWNTSGVYRQWSGLYLYSDQPIRLSQPTLVVEQKHNKIE